MMLINKLTNFLILAILLAACMPISTTIQPIPSSSFVSTSASTQILFKTTTPQASPTLDEMAEVTMIPTQTASEYCEKLLNSYHPANGYQTYCDTEYGFAFDYPSNWKKTIVAQSPDIASAPSTARRELIFNPGDMSNFIRSNTYHMYGNLSLQERVEYSLGYIDRAFPDKSYPTLVIGGHVAYAIMRCWQQDYGSAVYLYFQHYQYYTIMEVMVKNQFDLDTNWQIARSIQTPGYPPEKNDIPQELIDDSYNLLSCHVPPYPIYQITP
jgi:hypothetical protein